MSSAAKATEMETSATSAIDTTVLMGELASDRAVSARVTLHSTN